MYFTLDGKFIAKSVEAYMKMNKELPEEVNLTFLDLQGDEETPGLYNLVCMYDNVNLH